MGDFRDGGVNMNAARAGGTSDSSGNPPAIFFRDHDDESYEAERLQLVEMGFPDAAVMPHASYMLEHATISHLRPRRGEGGHRGARVRA